MPKYSAFFLFTALSSLGLPLLNGFVGEFLVLLGTWQTHWKWAAWGAIGVILSACYLLWVYQRVFYGEIKQEKNRTLADVNAREKWVMVSMCFLMLWLGLHARFFLLRFESTCETILQASPNQIREATVPGRPPALKATAGSE